MYQNERELEIRKILAQKGYASVQELSQWLYTSPSSIRRDLTTLEKRGLIKRSYGGAELITSSTNVTAFGARSDDHLPQKQAIAVSVITAARDMAQIGVVVAVMLIVCFAVLSKVVKSMKIAQALKLGED